LKGIVSHSDSGTIALTIPLIASQEICLDETFGNAFAVAGRQLDRVDWMLLKGVLVDRV
jgi:hypothetical protein